jgi:superfamily I DNA and/or RNA helicase
VAASTNTAVDRVLAGLLEAGFDDFSRVGAAKKIEPSLLGHLLPHSDREEAIRHALRELTEVLRAIGGHPGMLLATAPAAAPGEHCEGDGAAAAGAGSDLARRCAPVLAALRQLGDRRAVLDRLQSSRVVGTTCAAACFPILQGLAFPIVVLDEASQMPEPTSATPLARFGSRFAVVVGDPLQLPPVLQSPPVANPPAGAAAAGSASAASSSSSSSSSSSTMEGSTLFTRLAACGGAPLVALRTQYRCHPRLGDLASRLFYDGTLTSGVLPWQRGPRVRLLPPLALFDYSNLTAAEWARAGGAAALIAGSGAGAAHAAASSAGGRLASGPPFPPAAPGAAARFGDTVERADAGRSLFNAGEAALVAALVASLLGRGTPAGDVGVICLYRAQVFRVRDCLASLGVPVRLTGTEGDRGASRFSGAGGTAAAPGGGGGAVTVATVDAYQGAEKPIIILSPTRTSPCAVAAVGGPAAGAAASGAAEVSPAATAFADNPQRLNVALTRAKNHLLVVCHARALASYPLWRRIIGTVLSDGATAPPGVAGAEAAGAAAVARPSFRSAGMPDMLAPVAQAASGSGAGAAAPAAPQSLAITRYD